MLAKYKPVAQRMFSPEGRAQWSAEEKRVRNTRLDERSQPVSASHAATEATALRLVPFPKEIHIESGLFALKDPLVLEAPADQLPVIARLLGDELSRAGIPAPESRPIAEKGRIVRLFARGAAAVPLYAPRDQGSDEDYALRVAPGGVAVEGRGTAGLLHGVYTLVQLLRANRQDGGLPCLAVRDWPSLRWRCFQNDMTRGPSAKLETLRGQVALGALLKMNLFSMYMEHQFAFAKHPDIGPVDGSLTPDELCRLVAFAQPLGIDILGNQQSFGHLGAILKKEEYAALRENKDVLTPAKEESYRLLDDLYSEICPLLPFPMFNVGCDETGGLGSGPSKKMATKVGVGGVYTQHVCRVHDLLATKYKKRIMMWGDIVLKHPDKLSEIPKDTIMLSWGYEALPSFEMKITPFARPATTSSSARASPIGADPARFRSRRDQYPKLRSRRGQARRVGHDQYRVEG